MYALMRTIFVFGQFEPNAPGHLDPVETGHHQVRDHHVGPLAPHERETLRAARRVTHEGRHVMDRPEETADDQAVFLLSSMTTMVKGMVAAPGPETWPLGLSQPPCRVAKGQPLGGRLISFPGAAVRPRRRPRWRGPTPRRCRACRGRHRRPSRTPRAGWRRRSGG
jgi:hypothetical protein